MYYWLNVFGEIEESKYPLTWERDLKRSGNYFKSREDAIAVRNKIREILNESKEEDPMG